MRYFSLSLVNHFLDNLKFIQQAHRFTLFVKQHSRNVSQLNHKHVLSHTGIDCFSEQVAEELVIFTQFCNFCEFVLEMLPDIVTGLALSLSFSQ
jgi:hypothetical protein